MMFDHLLHQCCWPTCMDNLLRCALAPRNHSSIGLRASPSLCPCLSLCSHCLPCPCRRANRVCCPWDPFCLLSWLRHLSCHSSIHQLLFHDAMFTIRLVPFCLLLCRPCTLSKRWHTRLRMTCRCSCPSHSVSSSRHKQRHYPGPLVSVRHRPSSRSR